MLVDNKYLTIIIKFPFSVFAVLRAKNESPGDQKIAARVFSTSRFTPNKTRVYETKKNRTMTQ